MARSGGLRKLVTEQLGAIDARGVNSIPLFRDDDGRDVVVRVGRYGPYLQRTRPDTDESEVEGDRVSLPDGIAPDELVPAKVAELFLGGGGERELGEHPSTGEPVMLKSGRFGPYVMSGERRSSLLRAQSPETLTLDEALRLLTLPRTVGVAPDGVDVVVSGGRYGPYVKKGDETRSLESEEQLFTLTLDEALTLLAAPKTRGRRAPVAPLRELGVDPVTEKPMVIKDGRFGPYVTDGETNASLRRGQTVEGLTVEQASEMLSERRARVAEAPPRKRPAKKAAPAKATSKASGSKAAGSKAAASKTTSAPKKAARRKATGTT